MEGDEDTCVDDLCASTVLWSDSLSEEEEEDEDEDASFSEEEDEDDEKLACGAWMLEISSPSSASMATTVPTSMEDAFSSRKILPMIPSSWASMSTSANTV